MNFTSTTATTSPCKCFIALLGTRADADPSEPRQSFQNWEIAVLVNVVTSSEEEGNVTRCRLDFESEYPPFRSHDPQSDCFAAGRYVRQYCSFPGLDQGNAEIVRVWTRVVEFFTTEYFDMLETAQYHVIYHHDQRWPKPAAIPSLGGFGGHGHGEGDIDIDVETADASWEEFTEDVIDEHGVVVSGRHGVVAGGGEWKQISETVDMGGFDQIMAISQGGIIAHFLTLWNNARASKEASLVKWAYEDYFEATFKPMTVRLLSNGRAIVWIHLQEGFLKTLRNWLPWSEYVCHCLTIITACSC